MKKKVELAQYINTQAIAAIEQLPDYMQNGVLLYLLYGVDPGRFLYNVFANRLMHAVDAADGINIRYLEEYARLLYNIPTKCWGSENAVIAWMADGGFKGREKDDTPNVQ